MTRQEKQNERREIKNQISLKWSLVHSGVNIAANMAKIDTLRDNLATISNELDYGI